MFGFMDVTLFLSSDEIIGGIQCIKWSCSLAEGMDTYNPMSSCLSYLPVQAEITDLG